MASMVGSSWNAADSSGEAPTMSPAATVTVLRCPARASRRWVARYSTPPASVVTSVTLPPTSVVVGHDAPAGPAGRLEVPVEVVEGQDLEVERLVPGVGSWTCRW